jgi:ribA/ribD-fused uncharacterized protein
MARIARRATPGKAKATAKWLAAQKCLATHKRGEWAAVRESIMYELTKVKFMQPRLRKRLFETGLREIVEASHDDDFWGVTASGRGDNTMGKIIMRVRAELRRKCKLRTIEP